MNEASTIFSLIHQTLSGGENELSVSMMCQTAGVSRSGYYAWLNAASARQVREAQDRADFGGIQPAEIFQRGAGHLYVPYPQYSAGGYEPEKDTPVDEKIRLAMSDSEGKPLPQNEKRNENESLRA